MKLAIPAKREREREKERERERERYIYIYILQATVPFTIAVNILRLSQTISVPHYSYTFLLICNFAATYLASAQGVDISDFLNEINILKKIFEEGSSPYVVTLVGCVTLQEPVCLVTALVAHGNLRDYLNYI